jgi:signal transduction histidine kinase/DNA-binding response OmpR family regulator
MIFNFIILRSKSNVPALIVPGNRILIFVVANCLVSFYGCGDASPEKKYRIGFSQCCNDAWRDVMNDEMRRELTLHPELDFEIKVADGNSDLQVEQIRTLLKSGIDILLVTPNESKPLTAIIEEVYKTGIPVILIDRKTDSELYTAFIGADNYEIGTTAADYIASQTDGKGIILELQMSMAISPAVERHRGLIDGLRKYTGMQIAGHLEIPMLLEDPENDFPGFLQQHPDATIIFGQTDLLAETAYKMAREAGREKELFFVGIDGIPGTGQGIQAVEDGILNASLLYPTGGSEAIQLAIGILNNLPFEKKTTLQTIVINSTNARILHNQMKKEKSLQQSIEQQVKGLKSLKVIYRNQRVYILVLLSSLFLTMILGVFLWKSLRIKQSAFRSLEFKNKAILEHEQQLMSLTEEVRNATKAKVDFFTNLSHEFRTPLTLILAYAEDLIPSQKLTVDDQQSIGKIRQNAYRLLRLVNQLMDFRKSESGQLKLHVSENDLVTFVRNIVESYSKIAQKRGIDLQWLCRLERFPYRFDVDMMDKILFNLLSNAFKFTPDGGKILVSLEEYPFERTVKLTVEDSGHGISPEELTNVFDPFYQSEKHHIAGTGLGLSVTKTLVELHGGTIVAKSTVGAGSKFTLTLPVINDGIQNGSDVLTAIPNELLLPVLEMDSEEIDFYPDDSSAGKLILIIEDNEELQSFLRKKCRSLYQVEVASQGNEGLKKAFDLMPDIIICDIMLPGMDGLEITRMLKSDLRTSHIPIILLSARSSIEQQIEGTAAGADSYIPKPFNVQFLLAQINNQLRNRETLKESFGKNLAVQSRGMENLDLPEHTTPLDRDFIKRFVTYIDQHYNRQDFQITDLCQDLGLSRSQLYRKVTALLGERIGVYIENVRLKKAEELLLEGKITVTETAYQVGYSSPDYFSSVFKSKYNITPSQFRKITLDKKSAG